MTAKLSTPGDASWFVKDRFGLFIHWGLYALPARHEWVKSREKISDADYDKYFKYFDPDLYDPERWADAAASAGMKYFVITTKHHDGFCLWDSELTEYKSTNTPYGKDLLRPMVEAFNKRGLRTGFYHSLLDWHHPQYIVDSRNHPRRDEVDVQSSEVDGMIAQAGGDTAKTVAKVTVDPNQGRDQKKYAKYLRDQVRELLTDFGQVDILWFDFSFVDKADRENFAKGKGREAWESEELYKTIRELQPNILLTNRLDLDMPLSGGDLLTPEQAQPRQAVTFELDGKKVPVVWEACQTFSGSWGYHRDEKTWRSTRQLLSTLIDCVSKDGNLLLNVGPTGRGEFDHRAVERLEGMGKWMHHHSRSIYGCGPAPAELTTPQDCRLTYNPETKRCYVHLLNWPYKHLHLDGELAARTEYAQLLHDASEVQFMPDNDWHAQQTQRGSGTRTLILPQTEPEGIEIPVIELMLK